MKSSQIGLIAILVRSLPTFITITARRKRFLNRFSWIFTKTAPGGLDGRRGAPRNDNIGSVEGDSISSQKQKRISETFIIHWSPDTLHTMEWLSFVSSTVLCDCLCISMPPSRLNLILKLLSALSGEGHRVSLKFVRDNFVSTHEIDTSAFEILVDNMHHPILSLLWVRAMFCPMISTTKWHVKTSSELIDAFVKLWRDLSVIGQ